MNGRIYDPLLGRFLSADVLVQDPLSQQGYNRYSYVRNNPLSAIDPTGWAGEGAATTTSVLVAAGAADTTGVINLIQTLIAFTETSPVVVAGALATIDVSLGMQAAHAAPGFAGGNMSGGWGSASCQSSSWSIKHSDATGAQVASQKASQQVQSQSKAPPPAVDGNAPAPQGGDKIPSGPPSDDPEKKPVAKPESKQGGDPKEAAASEAKFGGEAQLKDHFDRHGGDFGAKDAGDYQSKAAGFLTGAPKDGVQQATRKNGDVVRFDPKTNDFGVIKKDGTIKTYYKPDPQVHHHATNQEYFNAQTK
jgi:uncharacterized protein RhaS with RHS repeats